MPALKMRWCEAVMWRD